MNPSILNKTRSDIEDRLMRLRAQLARLTRAHRIDDIDSFNYRSEQEIADEIDELETWLERHPLRRGESASRSS
jgi:hypothetical protein